MVLKHFSRCTFFLFLVGRSRGCSGLWLLWGSAHWCVPSSRACRAIAGALVLFALFTLLFVADLGLPCPWKGPLSTVWNLLQNTAKLHNGIRVERQYRLGNIKETLKMCFDTQKKRYRGGLRENPQLYFNYVYNYNVLINTKGTFYAAKKNPPKIMNQNYWLNVMFYLLPVLCHLLQLAWSPLQPVWPSSLTFFPTRKRMD